MHRVATIGFGVYVCVAMIGNAYPQPDLDAQSKALKLITESADKICNIVRTEGNSESEHVSGQVKAQLNGLIGKLVDMGISGAGSHNADHYAGLIREDLPKVLQNTADCKLKVFEKLQDKMIIHVGHRESNCPSIGGTWSFADLNVDITIFQHGCTINSEWTHGSVIHVLKGKGDSDGFEFTVKETDAYGCTAIEYGKFTEIEQEQMNSHIYRTSGTCGLLPNRQQTLPLVRR